RGPPAEPSRGHQEAVMKSIVLGALTVVAITVTPASARAQLVDVTDPCFIAFFGRDAKSILATGTPGNKTHLEDAALSIRATVSTLLNVVREILKEGTGGTLTPVDLELLRAKNRCLPWLERQLGLIVGQLKRMGSSDIALPDQRHPVALDPFVKEVVDALKEA